MIRVNGYQIYFKHYPEEQGIIDSHAKVPVPYEGKTLCFVDKNGEGITEGAAFCGIGDTFNKAVGRKVSLQRAIEDFPKDLRSDIWKEYISTVKNI